MVATPLIRALGRHSPAAGPTPTPGGPLVVNYSAEDMNFKTPIILF